MARNGPLAWYSFSPPPMLYCTVLCLASRACTQKRSLYQIILKSYGMAIPYPWLGFRMQIPPAFIPMKPSEFISVNSQWSPTNPVCTILPPVAVLYSSRYCMFRYKFSAYPAGTYWYHSHSPACCGNTIVGTACLGTNSRRTQQVPTGTTPILPLVAVVQ